MILYSPITARRAISLGFSRISLRSNTTRRKANITEKDDCFRNRLFLGGSGWIRTTEGGANRFTVCPLWPLGNTPIFSLQKNGAGGRTRTPDLLITNQLLYQLSYTSTLMLEQYNTILFRCQAYFSNFLKIFIFFILP